MFIDARNLEPETILEADVCIVGAGPAGITLAQELMGSSLKVCLLESGGIDACGSAQALNQSMEAVGDQIPPCPTGYPAGDGLRLRRFGGTSHKWLRDNLPEVRYVPLEEIDFEPRDWVSGSGWPIRRSDLDPFYERAQKICQIGPYAYEPEQWETEDLHQFASDQLDTRMFQLGVNKPFTQDAYEVLQKAPNVTTYLYASVYELALDQTTHKIHRAKVLTLDGQPLWMQARHFILACGALENARILLMSNQVQPKGLGNQHDLVGRYLMDHQVVRLGHLSLAPGKTIRDMDFYGIRRLGHFELQGKPILSRKTMEQEKLLNMAILFSPRPARAKFNPLRMLFPQGKRYVSQAISSGIQLSRSLKHRQLSSKTLKYLKEVFSGLDDIIYFQVRKFSPFEIGGKWPQDPDSGKKYGAFAVYGFTEQPPDFHNRVVLGSEQDRFGYPKLQVHWQWTEETRHSIVRAQTIFAEELVKAGIGTLKLELDKGDPQLAKSSVHHPMGTTRMHEQPDQGVVDANCQVHGIHNLFIAGSSVFPTGGFANSTFTIIALSIRLADHIKAVTRPT